MARTVHLASPLGGNTLRASRRSRFAKTPPKVGGTAVLEGRRARLLARRRARHQRSRRRALTLAMIATLGVLAFGRGSFAYFTTTGTGSGSASTGTVSALTLNGTATFSADLTPDGFDRTISFSVHNPNNFAVTAYSIVGGTITVDGTHLGNGCAASNVTFTDQPALNPVLNPTATIGAFSNLSLNAKAQMLTGAANACQGATFMIPVTITVRLP